MMPVKYDICNPIAVVNDVVTGKSPQQSWSTFNEKDCGDDVGLKSSLQGDSRLKQYIVNFSYSYNDLYVVSYSI